MELDFDLTILASETSSKIRKHLIIVSSSGDSHLNVNRLKIVSTNSSVLLKLWFLLFLYLVVFFFFFCFCYQWKWIINDWLVFLLLCLTWRAMKILDVLIHIPLKDSFSLIIQKCLFRLMYTFKKQMRVWNFTHLYITKLSPRLHNTLSWRATRFPFTPFSPSLKLEDWRLIP